MGVRSTEQSVGINVGRQAPDLDTQLSGWKTGSWMISGQRERRLHMVRSLWTAATGMIAQQTNVDTIANNLANVNTTGYKTQVNEFKSLLYQNIQTKQPPLMEMRNRAVHRWDWAYGMLPSVPCLGRKPDGIRTATPHLQLTVKGIFAVRGADGNTYYTRNGNLKFTLASNGGNMLATSEGLPVLDTQGRPIVLSNNYVMSKVTVSKDGSLCYPDAQNNPQPIGITIGVFQFNNPNGLRDWQTACISRQQPVDRRSTKLPIIMWNEAVSSRDIWKAPTYR